jgi:ADP-heptose:LPS heptosyltransferase
MQKSANNKTYRNILITAFTRLGDTLQASPMIKLMKETYPQAKITILASREIVPVCKALSEIDEIIIFDTNEYFHNLKRPGVSTLQAYNNISAVVNDLRAKKFDLCLDISYSLYAAYFIPLLNIKESQLMTFDEYGQHVMTNHWHRLFKTISNNEANRKYQPINLVDINILAAGLKPKYQKLFFTPSAQDYAAVQQFLDDYGISKTKDPIICIQCGSSQKKRQWGAERFAAVAKTLVESLNAWIIYPGSPGEKALISEAVNCYSHSHVINGAGLHSFSELAALLERSDLLVTGDTGPMHLAAAMGTPSVSMFVGPSYCSETGPYSAGNIIVEPKISCYACSHKKDECVKPLCYDKINPQAVAELCKIRMQTKNLEDLLNLKISADLVNPKDMTVKVSYFDQDGFLEFKIISEIINFAESRIENIKAAYKQIWKEEFIQTKASNATTLQPANQMTQPQFNLPQLTSAYKLLDDCAKKVNQLNKALKRNDVSQAKKIVAKIDNLDKELINTTKTNPILGVITNMYECEKISITSNDVQEVISKTRKNHAAFKRRLKRFEELTREA